MAPRLRDDLVAATVDEGDVTYVDLPTGHWPMFSRPRDLAGVIVDAVS